jgi:cytochrome c biogenesis protein ResB
MSNPTPPDVEQEPEHFPIEPRYHPIHKIPRKIYDFLASAKLAMALLVTILACCLTGVTVFRGQQAWSLVFNTLWYNALLVLLVINIACCFFGRIWHRKITVISFGMILFHISFVAILLAVVYNSLFYFRGTIRLTEGERLQSGDPQSYDHVDKGRYFSFTRLKGETTLIKMHTGYKVSGDDKRAAYEVEVGEGSDRKQGIIYITHKLSHHGFDYFNDREGYSLLVTLANKQGQDLYGAHLPLQSIRSNEESYLYTTGYTENGVVTQFPVPFPAPPENPLMALQVDYHPSKLKERGGEASFKLFPLDEKGLPQSGGRPFSEGKAPIGERFVAGEYVLSAREVRYWAAMTVRYEPGKPIVLTSLWVGLAGMCITTVGRMLRSRRKGA